MTDRSSWQDRFTKRLFRQNELVMKLGLGPISAALAECSHPHRRYPHILVGGTNGKGTTASAIAAILDGLGHTAGLFTSPHLVSFRERFRIGGAVLDEERLRAVGGAVLETYGGTPRWRDEGRPPIAEVAIPPHSDLRLTYFELCTMIGAVAFAAEPVSAGVFEVGLGGRLDATNALDPVVSVVTSIGLDHQAILGDTVEAIAREKAAIARPGKALVVGTREAAATVVDEARARGAEPLTLGDDFGWSRRDGAVQIWSGEGRALLPGYLAAAPDYYLDNLTTALTTVMAFSTAIGRPDLGLEDIAPLVIRHQWPGRLTKLRVPGRQAPLIVDGAHNPAAMKVTVDYLVTRYARMTVIFGVLSDKDAAEMVAELDRIAGRFIFVRLFSNRSADPSVVARSTGLPHTIAESMAGALSITGDEVDPVLITGSLYGVGEAIETLGLSSELEQFASKGPFSWDWTAPPRSETDMAQARIQKNAPLSPPVDGDMQHAKRELIKLGLEQGHLDQKQLAEFLPLKHMSDVELEVLSFTLESLGIQVRS